MSNLIQLYDKDGSPVYPITSLDSVRDSQGKTIEQVVQGKADDDKVVKTVSQSLTSTDQLQARQNINAQEKIVAGSGISIAEDGKTISANGGGGESGVQGVISQTQTWASDGFSYTMTDIVRGTIPQANIDLFTSMGAEFNNTSSAITKTTPWGESVQHLSGYFYLNGLGDISYSEMIKIYNAGTIQDLIARTTYDRSGVRTFFKVWTSNLEKSEELNGVFFYSGSGKLPTLYSSEIITFNGMVLPMSTVSWTFNIGDLSRLRVVYGIIDCTTWVPYAMQGCRSLEYVYLKGIKQNTTKIDVASKLNLVSILYMIQNASNGTTNITITLHASAYARAMANADIQSALTANGHITLASA